MDANYAVGLRIDRCQVSGVDVFCGGSRASCFSRTQSYVTLSIAEEEYMAMANTLKEALYIHQGCVIVCEA